MEEDKDILRRVRRIEIKARGLSRELFAGRYHSAFRGRGMAFAEVREYEVGDDVRDIDWNVTARSGEAFVKTYEEERELTVMLVVDVSSSRMFGTTEKTKRSVITEIAAVLAFSAAQNNDKVGCLFFSDRVEKFIPPKKGRGHVLMIIRELVGFEPQAGGTSLSVPLRFLTNTQKKRATTFVLSDFVCGEPWEDALKIAASKHDVVGVRVWDRREAELPDVGLVAMSDSETGRQRQVDTASHRVREQWARSWREHADEVERTLRRCRVDNVAVDTSEDYVVALMRLFKRRR